MAGLLDQERPNIFTQSVANIIPTQVKITISYVETLALRGRLLRVRLPHGGGAALHPRPPTGRQGGGWAPDTDRVPDASRITPPVAPGTRAGHDISIQVSLDAGFPSTACDRPRMKSKPSANRAVVRLKDRAGIPNKDFILRYDVAGQDRRRRPGAPGPEAVSSP